MIRNKVNYKIFLGYIITSFFMSVLFSCDSFFYENKIDFDDKEWNYDELLTYKFEITQPKENYDIYIDFVCTEEYKTNNIWIFLKIISPSGKSQNDIIEFLVTDNMGKWLGEKNSNLIVNKFLYKNDIKFAEAGNYTVILQQGMREKDTPIAVSTGLSLKKK